MEPINNILLSWIAEWVYCKRRFYLRVIENNIVNNQYMIEGARDHERAHSTSIEKRGKIITVRGLQVYSEKYQLFGVCDVVEFMIDSTGVYIPFLNEVCNIIPIEYKHGKVRNEKAYNYQMIAQAICLEEMLHIKISRGYIYYTTAKQRKEVIIDQESKERVIETISEISNYLVSPNLIHAELKRRCNGCSIRETCNPRNDITEQYMSKIRKKYLGGTVL